MTVKERIRFTASGRARGSDHRHRSEGAHQAVGNRQDLPQSHGRRRAPRIRMRGRDGPRQVGESTLSRLRSARLVVVPLRPDCVVRAGWGSTFMYAARRDSRCRRHRRPAPSGARRRAPPKLFMGGAHAGGGATSCSSPRAAQPGSRS